MDSQRTFTFHIPGLVHLPCNRSFMACAFTQKIYNLIRMLKQNGHTVYFYGAEDSDPPADEVIVTHSLEDIRDTWGEGDRRFSIGYDWRRKGFKHDIGKPERARLTSRFYSTCIDEINKRKKDDDFLLLMQGTYHQPIDQGVGLHMTCEPGIGYRGSYARYRAFESNYIRYFMYGSENPRGSADGNFYDRVIPNYYDPSDFYVTDSPDDYLFYIGRLIFRKGITIADKVASATGRKLIVAGQEVDSWKQGEWVKCLDGTLLNSPGIEYVGCLGPDARAEYMSHAHAVMVPTIYLEPFGGTNAEAQMCGTPVITTDFGAFTDTVIHGETGFRCNTLQDFVLAVNSAGSLNRTLIHRLAFDRFSMEKVRWLFEKWFRDIYQVYLSTRDSSVDGWHHLEDTESGRNLFIEQQFAELMDAR